ncbi:hypothetical protein [Paenibacillus dendritiformis]|uniref:hypothetical protein n=1 Tax=Paenibacillus dendritiformis TaxID=130049 RepID=UPI00387E08F7
MKKFKVEVITTNIYEIELDENVFNKEWVTNFKEDFYDIDTLEEHALNLAIQRSKQVCRNDSFIEGYGTVRVKPGGFDSKEWESVVDGIVIKVISEEENIEAEAMI